MFAISSAPARYAFLNVSQHSVAYINIKSAAGQIRRGELLLATPSCLPAVAGRRQVTPKRA
jgi:hypothetical protein